MNLRQVGVGSNIVSNHLSSSYKKSYMIIIRPYSNEKLTKSEIMSS